MSGSSQLIVALLTLVAYTSNGCEAQPQYVTNNIRGAYGANEAASGANPTSQQYIIYNREIPQTQFASSTSERQQPVYYKIVDPAQNTNVQNVRQQPFAYDVNQPQNRQEQQAQGQQQVLTVGQQQSQKLFHVTNVPYQHQQQQQQFINNNNNNFQLIANGNSLSTQPSSATPQSSSLPASQSSPFSPLLPVNIIDDVTEDTTPDPTQPGHCQMCCVANEIPCSNCCDYSGFLNIKTLKSTVG